MENFDDFEHKSYRKAARLDYTVKDHLNFLINFLSFLIKLNVVLWQEIFVNFLKLFNPDKPKNIAGQVALVTGGANGLGREIAFRLAKEKCNIVIIDLNLVEAQNTALEIAKTFNVKTAAFKVDVSDFDAILKVKKEIESTLGFVDILVNNAGILSRISLREGQPSDVQKVIDVNLTSHYWTVRAFLDTMIERKRGHIVAISSLGGKISIPLACLYVGTKFGVKGFMNALYDELCVEDSDEYIKTTCVFPGFINTRQELSEVLDTTTEMAPRLTAEYTAEVIVDGILHNRREIIIPAHLKYLQFVNWLPAKAMKFAKKQMAPVGHTRTPVSNKS